jgi:hypothetical protein
MTVHTTSATPASGSRMGAGADLPRAARSGVAPLTTNTELLQTLLFWTGAVLMPLGIVLVAFGWYGVANTPFGYDQQAYIVSGGFGGLALTFVGGFLYFGAWLARIAEDNREASKRLGDTLLVLADVTSRTAALNDQGVDTGSVLVTAGQGGTVHRRDCSLIAHRDDLTPAGARADTLPRCRVCRP